MENLRVKLGPLVPGGQTICDIHQPDGSIKKGFVWGGLPDEEAELRIVKKRAGVIEAVVEQVLTQSPYRVSAEDKNSFLSTSPWQIMDWDYELEQKALLVKQAFAQQHIKIETPVIKTDNKDYHYRNKMEFTWWWSNEADRLELAHYRRGAKGKIPVDGSSLARPEINLVAQAIRDLLNRLGVQARQLKTLLIRSSADGQTVAQLFVVDQKFPRLNEAAVYKLGLTGLEVIYSNPKSPASVVTKLLQSFGANKLTDQIGQRNFTYPAGSFFQINLPVYELALAEITNQLHPTQPLVELYAGVGTIGLTVVKDQLISLVEIDSAAVDELRANIETLKMSNARAILSPAELAVDHIVQDCQLIVDPPRAGLHSKVIDRILEVGPSRVIYLSCNPITQARDIAQLQSRYDIEAVTAFDFFPKTPHIENLVILNIKP